MRIAIFVLCVGKLFRRSIETYGNYKDNAHVPFCLISRDINLLHSYWISVAIALCILT